MKLIYLFLLSLLTLTPTVTPIPRATIGLVGDLGLGRTITSYARAKNDFTHSFSGLSSWLSQNDFTLANLESPIIDHCPVLSPTTMIFCGDIRFLPQLASHKFIFNLANNHILNFGPDGLSQTKTYLSQHSIPFVYSHQPDTQFTTRAINGISFGFLGFDLTGAHQYSTDDILSLTAVHAPQVDWLIVSLHWGLEYLPAPKPWRVDLAHRLVSAGADIIHGHHPHVWQTPETYQGKLIFYSFGNFIFDQNWSYSTSHSHIVRLTLTKDKIIDSQTFPIQITANTRPIILSP